MSRCITTLNDPNWVLAMEARKNAAAADAQRNAAHASARVEAAATGKPVTYWAYGIPGHYTPDGESHYGVAPEAAA